MAAANNQQSVTDILEQIRSDLFREVNLNNDHLSENLQSRINRLSQSTRKALMDEVRNGCSALFIACRKGNIKIVDYLIRVCGANIAQKGDLPELDNITLLWCACRFGHLQIVKYLITIGCDVDALSNNSSTALEIACSTTNIEIVQYLIENGADIRKPCTDGVTYLSDSIGSITLCKYLINKGADVNGRDMFGSTVLHEAVSKKNLETVELLLDHGADPFAKNCDGSDALQDACAKGSTTIAEYLMGRVRYSPERLADAYLLLGSTMMSTYDDMQRTLVYWRQAYDIRRGEHSYVQSRPQIAPRAAYRNAVEFTSAAELEEIARNKDALRMQSLLIQERIYGIAHNLTLDRLMGVGNLFIHNGNFQTGIDLYLLALNEQTQTHTILCDKTCNLAMDIFGFYLVKINENNSVVRFEDVYSTFKILSSNIEEIQQLLTIRPVCEQQAINYDCILQCLTHLIYILLHVAKSNAERLLIEASVRHLIRNNIRSTLSEKTLLHLSVLDASLIQEDALSPNKDVTRFLLECGAYVNANDNERSTPLHLASKYYNKKVVHTLIEYGAHLDLPNLSGERPSSLLEENPANDIYVHEHISLQCICANTIVASGLPYRNKLPRPLQKIVEAHDHVSSN